MPLNRLNSSGWWKWSELYSLRNKVLNYRTSLWYFNDWVRALLVWGWGEEEATLVGGWLMLCMVPVFSRPRVSSCSAWPMPQHRQQSVSVCLCQTLNDGCWLMPHHRQQSVNVCSCQMFNDGRGNKDLKNFLWNIIGKWQSEPFIPLFLHSWDQPLSRDSVGKSGSTAWLKKRGISVWKDAQQWGQGSSAVAMVCQMCRDLRDWALRLSQQTHMWVCISVGVAWWSDWVFVIVLFLYVCTLYGYVFVSLNILFQHVAYLCLLDMKMIDFYLFWDRASLYSPGRMVLNYEELPASAID